jgi:glycosyltransferase involved in cell wall biosynthesis
VKLLFVGNTAWSMWNFRGATMTYLRKQGHEIYVAAPEDSYTKELEAAGLHYIRLKNLNRKSLNPLNEIKLFFELLRLYRRLEPELIFQYTIKPNIWGSFAAGAVRTRAIAVVSGLGYVFINKTWLTRLASLLYKFSFYFCQKVIFLNEDDRNDFLRLGIVTEHGKTMVMNGEGVDTEFFKPSNTPLYFPKTPVFLLVGRLLSDKGVTDFVDAARIVKRSFPAVRFQLLGPIDTDNPTTISQEQIDSWTTEGLIEHLGVTKDVRPYIEACTAIVLPSRYLEGMNRSLMEAMAMGKPIVTSDIRGCRELVNPSVNGFLVQPKDFKSLARILEELILKDGNQVQKMGLASRELARTSFSIKNVIDTYNSILQGVKV